MIISNFSLLLRDFSENSSLIFIWILQSDNSHAALPDLTRHSRHQVSPLFPYLGRHRITIYFDASRFLASEMFFVNHSAVFLVDSVEFKSWSCQSIRISLGHTQEILAVWCPQSSAFHVESAQLLCVYREINILQIKNFISEGYTQVHADFSPIFTRSLLEEHTSPT